MAADGHNLEAENPIGRLSSGRRAARQSQANLRPCVPVLFSHHKTHLAKPIVCVALVRGNSDKDDYKTTTTTTGNNLATRASGREVAEKWPALIIARLP